MEAAVIESAPAPAPAPAVEPSPSPEPIPGTGGRLWHSDAPTVDAPKSAPIELPKDGEVPFDLDHPKDAQPDLRDVFPDQPAPKEARPERGEPEREQPEPQLQHPEAPEPIRLPEIFQADGDRAVWQSWPRETQEFASALVEATREAVRPQLERSEAMSSAHEQAFWAALSLVHKGSAEHNKKLAAVQELARTNPQAYEQLMSSPDGERIARELMAERAALEPAGAQLMSHGKQIVEQLQQARQAQAEQDQAAFTQNAEAFDAEFREFAPEAQDPDKWDALQDGVIGFLTDPSAPIGVPEGDLTALWNGEGIKVSDGRGGQRDMTASEIVRSVPFQKIAYYAFKGYQNEMRLAEVQKEQAQIRRERSQMQPRPLSPGGGYTAAMMPSNSLRSAAENNDMATYIRLRNSGAIR